MAGSAWVTVSARSNSGSASVMLPCTAVTIVSTCRDQPIDQLSSAWVAASRASAATRPAVSTSPRMLCVRAVSTSSRARCRAEIPGVASAWSSVASESADRPPTSGTGPASSAGRPARPGPPSGPARGWPAARPRPGRRPGTARRPACSPGCRAGPSRPGNWPRRAGGAPPPPGAPGGPAARRSWPASRGSTRPSGRPRRRPPLTAPSSCRATRSAGAPASASERAASRCQAARSGAGISPYSAALITGWRKPRLLPDSASTPAAQRLVHRRDQVGHAAAEHDGQVGHGEVHAEQGGGPQHLPHRAGHEAEPVGDGRGQGARGRAAGQLGGARAGHGQAGAAVQRRDQLGQVERVARGAVGEAQQAGVRPAAGQRGDQLVHVPVGQAGELEAGGTRRACSAGPAGRPAAAPGASCRSAAAAACGADRARRRHSATVAGSAHWRSSTTRTVGEVAHCSRDQGEQLLGQRSRDVRAAVGGELALQQPDDHVPSRVGRRLANA